VLRFDGDASRTPIGDPPLPHPFRSPPVWLVLVVGTLAVSTAAPLIGLVGMPALAIAAWRTTCAAAFYGALALGRNGRSDGPDERSARWRLHGARDLASLVAGAALLAAHFGLWIAAFEHTSYASSVHSLGTKSLLLNVIMNRLCKLRTDWMTNTSYPLPILDWVMWRCKRVILLLHCRSILNA
jgi:hypothetical protein